MVTICVAIGQRKGADTLTEAQLNTGWYANPHGGGYSYIDPESGKIKIKKFMEREPFVAAYLRDHDAYGSKTPFIVHMRIATHGKVMEDTAHPFRIKVPEGEMAFAHNGVISAVTKHTDDKRSDTMAFRDLFLNVLPVGWLDNPAIVELVEDFIGWSKLVFISTDTDTADDMYILNEDSGFWDGENWFSNRSCEPKVVKPYTGKKGQRYTYKKQANGTWTKKAWPKEEEDEYVEWWDEYGWDKQEGNTPQRDKDDLIEECELPKDSNKAMSFVVRENMNSLVLGEYWEVVLEEAQKQGYCPFCLFSPCKCEDTCYFCNHRQEHCGCDVWWAIGDMKSSVTDDPVDFDIIRKEDLQRLVEEEGLILS